MVVYVEAAQVWLLSKGEALCHVEHGNQHVFIGLDALDIHYVSSDEILIQVYVVEFGGYFHHMDDTVGDIVV